MHALIESVNSAANVYLMTLLSELKQSHFQLFYLPFPKDARATTCFENLCYQNMQVTIYEQNFPDMLMNTLDQQFFQLQLSASNLDLLFEASDEFEDVQQRQEIQLLEDLILTLIQQAF
ncbi:MAG: hypothetical protein EZS28_044328 [Streblomastix strix]|uniref:Uncharacterized protein n=1 Tax=Streblomastix strix TaxID=222440 RepID=A0A5J4TNW0_9EUKA|nr:MAG: hypothetical protein EZS28_044328 [Streblomastix strix]